MPRGRCKAAFHSFRLIFASVGVERASTVRQRERGQRCAACDVYLGGDRGEVGNWRFCARCAPQRHRAYLTFFVRGAGQWVCSFLEPDLRTPVGRGCLFGSAEKVRELVRKSQTRLEEAERRTLEAGLETGRGGLWLELSAEQYLRLKRPR